MKDERVERRRHAAGGPMPGSEDLYRTFAGNPSPAACSASFMAAQPVECWCTARLAHVCLRRGVSLVVGHLGAGYPRPPAVNGVTDQHRSRLVRLIVARA